ncbi:hypothetical protein [Streptomyces sp. G1]|uniref:hypothetical protein n=1 Tax=Streptomyces sp. G1 TaxID=361572 RepID=UPI002030CE7D|nr:hypothetical protein [Streptomyces sp. G1]MCM1974595.1 hypothetical protein [Streptomyces sp. G1]
MTPASRKVLLVIAGHARDKEDCRLIMAMLGVTPPKPKRRRGRPPVDHGHGHHRTYYKGCRCADCREAYRQYAATLRDKWRNDPTSADRAGHGKSSTYRNHACRCAACKEANRVEVNEYRARRRQRAALAEAGDAR